MEDRKLRDWTGTFQRLRAETVSFSVVIFAFSHGQATLQQVLFVHFAQPLSRGVILLGLVIFWVFAAISWWVRYYRETAEDRDWLDKASVLIGQASINRDYLMQWKPPSIDETSKIPDLEYLSDAASKAKVALAELRAAGAGDADFRQTLDSIADRAQTGMDTVMARIAAYQNELEAYKAYAAGVGDEMPGNLLSYSEKISSWERETKSIAVILTWERKWLGFVIPLGFSAFIVLTSLPQITIDVGQAVTQGAACVQQKGIIGCLVRTVPFPNLSAVPPDLIWR